MRASAPEASTSRVTANAGSHSLHPLVGALGAYRGQRTPTESGFYALDASQADGWCGPNGFVEVRFYADANWAWCYWLETDKKRKPVRCGIPLHLTKGARWTGPLRPNAKLSGANNPKDSHD